MLLDNFYSGKKYKLYMAIPAALFIVFAFLAFVYPAVPKGIDLQGGTLIVIRGDKPIDAVELEQILDSRFDLIDLKVNSITGPSGSGVNVQFAASASIQSASQQIDSAKAMLAANPSGALQETQTAVDSISVFLNSTELPNQPDKAVLQAELYLIEAKKNLIQEIQQTIIQTFSLPETVAFQIRDVSPALGAAFWQTALNVSIMAAILMTMVIFFFFRKIVPTIAVLQAALFDVLAALGLMAVTGIPLSLSSIPALLMLVGYSVDTDIMLTTRVLQGKEGTPASRAAGSLGTGLTMTGTTIAALLSMALISYMNQITVIFEIAVVLLFGLVGDIISTWFMNAGIMLYYSERKNKTKGVF